MIRSLFFMLLVLAIAACSAPGSGSAKLAPPPDLTGQYSGKLAMTMPDTTGMDIATKNLSKMMVGMMSSMSPSYTITRDSIAILLEGWPAVNARFPYTQAHDTVYFHRESGNIDTLKVTKATDGWVVSNSAQKLTLTRKR